MTLMINNDYCINDDGSSIKNDKDNNKTVYSNNNTNNNNTSKKYDFYLISIHRRLDRANKVNWNKIEW